MKYLGIDVGTKRTGTAIADTENYLAFPREVIDVVAAGDDLSQQIINIMQSEGATEVVLGESKDKDGKDNSIMTEVRALQAALEQKGVKVHLEPEFYSSVQAEKFQGKNDHLDSSAAAIILQSFMDRLKNQVVEPVSYIQFDDFAKVELRIGKVINAELVEKSEKLLRLSVDFAEAAPRQVISGIRSQFNDPVELVNRCFVFVTNLEPRKIMGLESRAMIVAGRDESGLALMTPTIDLAPGTLLS